MNTAGFKSAGSEAVVSVVNRWRNSIITAVESLGPINCSAVSFLSGLGRRIAEVSAETRDGRFPVHRLSVLIQRCNAVLLHDCSVDEVAGHSS